VGAHPLFSTLSRRGLNPIKLVYSPSPPDNELGQYVSSPGNRAYCYAELAVSSLAMAVIIASTHFAYPRRDGQAKLPWDDCVGGCLENLIILKKSNHAYKECYKTTSHREMLQIFNQPSAAKEHDLDGDGRQQRRIL